MTPPSHPRRVRLDAARRNRCVASNFTTALLDTGVPEDVARNILRDARATVRHGPGSTSCARLLRAIEPYGWSVEICAKPALVMGAGGKRVPIPEGAL